MHKYIRIFLVLFLFCFYLTSVKADEPNIVYTSHVQNQGWQNNVKNGEISGTTGRTLRIEAIRIDLNGIGGEVVYSSHIQNVGWQKEVTNTLVSGTTGRSLRLEAIKINLTGEVAEKYDVYYQAHVQNQGWQPWKKNGEISGTTGMNRRLEAIRIKLVSKENPVTLTYKTNVQGVGWQNSVNNGEISGTVGEGKAINQINLSLSNPTGISGNIEYDSYVIPNEWQGYVTSDKNSGISGKAIEAIRIRLTGELAKKYNIFYRTHVSNVGWMDWTSNGEISGTIGYFNRVEAIQVKLEKKDMQTITTGKNSYKETTNNVLYSSHVQSVGWDSYVKNGEVSGTTGKGLRVEAIKIKLNSTLSGRIDYHVYVENEGWKNVVNNDTISGTVGKGKRLEGIRINIVGDISKYYQIYYRIHVSNVGWMDWATNAEYTGCFNSNKKIEAIQIKLVKKGMPAPGATTKKYLTGKWENNGYTDYFGNRSYGFKYIDGQKDYFDGNGNLAAKNAKKIIDVSAYQKDINWDTIKSIGDVDGAIIRVGWGMSYNDEAGTDSKFDRNIKAVQRLGIPYSIYLYGYATCNNAAEKEAKFVTEMMKKYNIPSNTFIWYDAEENRSRNIYNQVIPTFVNRMHSNGYKNVGVYGNLYYLDSTNGVLNTNTIRNYPIWVAQYYKKLQYTGNWRGWQFTSTGSINGINGNVDVSVFK